MRTLRRYAPGHLSREVDSHLIKGERWLRPQRAASLLDVAGKVCAFSVTSHKERQLQSAVEDLRNRQLADCSWAQHPGMNGDAYATRLALVALREAGHLESGSPTYQRGVDFLLRAQEEDGSRLVRARAIPLNGFLEAVRRTISISSSPSQQRAGRRWLSCSV
jgi:hypothetical protein